MDRTDDTGSRAWWVGSVLSAGLVSACYTGADVPDSAGGDGDGSVPTNPAEMEESGDESIGDVSDGSAPTAGDDTGVAATDTGVADCDEPAEPFVVERVLLGFEAEPVPTTLVAGAIQADLVSPLVGLRSGLYEIHGHKVCAAVDEFEAQATIRYAEPVYLVTPSLVVNDPRRAEQWNFDRVRATEAWDRSTGAGVVVAVLDTGLRAGADGVRHVDGASCMSGTCTPGGFDDTHGHGTHVAGTIAQTTNNGIGVAGLAFDATVLPIKVLHLNQQGEHKGNDADIAQGIVYAANHGAQVINMSLGAQSACGQTYTDAIAYARQLGVNVVVAAGNDAVGTLSSPANCPGAIAVSASGQDDLLAEFSNWDAGATQGNLAAPGVGIMQEVPPNGSMCPLWADVQSDGVQACPGTSMASPHVAAGAALLRAVGAPEGKVLDHLRTTATSVIDGDRWLRIIRLDWALERQMQCTPADDRKFGDYSQWISGHGVGSSRQFLADVDGDKRDDAVVFFVDSGAWYVALSTGNGFAGWSQWIAGHGTGSDNQMLADVDGNGMADAVVFFNHDEVNENPDFNGAWYVATSNGAGFGPFYAKWMTGHGTGSDAQMLGDVDGNGTADAIVFFNHDEVNENPDFNGAWYVATSNGAGFGPFYGKWMTGHGTGSDVQFLADVDGNGADDAVVFFNNHGSPELDGAWYVATSTGGGFGPFYAKWIQGHGTGSGRQFVADFTGDQKADAMVYFDTNPNSWCFAGSWYGAVSDGGQFGPYYAAWVSGHGRGSTQQLAGDVDGDGRADAVVYFADSGTWYVAASLHP